MKSRSPDEEQLKRRAYVWATRAVESARVGEKAQRQTQRCALSL